MAARYVVRRSGAQYHFTLKAGNNEVILSSERYVTKQNALDGITSVKSNSPYDSRYERKTTTNGQYMFNLKAGNGQVICTSETYSTAQARDRGIESVQANGPGASIDDQT